MKKLIIIATAVLLIVVHTGSAQNKTQPHPYPNTNKQVQIQSMMNQWMCPMCSQMMDQDMPMKKYGMMVNQLPNMQQQLSLNDKQMEQLNDLQVDFKKQQVDFQSELKKKQIMVQKLLDEMVPANQIEKQMQECANTKISMSVSAYETAVKMKDVLNNDQKELLNNRMMQQDGIMNPKQNGMKQKRNGVMNHDHGEKMKKKNN